MVYLLAAYPAHYDTQSSAEGVCGGKCQAHQWGHLRFHKMWSPIYAWVFKRFRYLRDIIWGVGCSPARYSQLFGYLRVRAIATHGMYESKLCFWLRHFSHIINKLYYIMRQLLYLLHNEDNTKELTYLLFITGWWQALLACHRSRRIKKD